MALTKHYRQTEAARIQRDRKVPRALFAEAICAVLAGETAEGHSLLRERAWRGRPRYADCYPTLLTLLQRRPGSAHCAVPHVAESDGGSAFVWGNALRAVLGRGRTYAVTARRDRLTTLAGLGRCLGRF